jgi:mono/diheme cytochrome c family protein
MKAILPFTKSLLFIPIFILGFQNSKAQNLIVPAADKAKASPIAFNVATAKDGKTVYETNCVSCHGNPGKNNNMKALNPVPKDLGTADAQNQTDGDLFYKISEGNPLMPKFKTILPEKDRWKLVAYIRSFNPKYVQPALPKAAANLLSKAVHVNMTFDKSSNRISLLVRAVVKNDTITLKGSEVTLFVKRYFGNLPIGNTIKTNNDGIASIDFPKNIPGDKAGNLNLAYRINDEVYGEIDASKTLKIGIPTDIPGLTMKRAIWNVEAKAPIWLLLTYFSILAGVWITILYIVFNIYRIKQAGRNINI